MAYNLPLNRLQGSLGIDGRTILERVLKEIGIILIGLIRLRIGIAENPCECGSISEMCPQSFQSPLRCLKVKSHSYFYCNCKRNLKDEIIKLTRFSRNLTSLVAATLTTWLMEPEGSIPHSQGLSKSPYPEPNQHNSSH